MTPEVSLLIFLAGMARAGASLRDALDYYRRATVTVRETREGQQ